MFRTPSHVFKSGCRGLAQEGAAPSRAVPAGYTDRGGRRRRPDRRTLAAALLRRLNMTVDFCHFPLAEAWKSSMAAVVRRSSLAVTREPRREHARRRERRTPSPQALACWARGSSSPPTERRLNAKIAGGDRDRLRAPRSSPCGVEAGSIACSTRRRTPDAAPASQILLFAIKSARRLARRCATASANPHPHLPRTACYAGITDAIRCRWVGSCASVLDVIRRQSGLRAPLLAASGDGREFLCETRSAA